MKGFRKLSNGLLSLSLLSWVLSLARGSMLTDIERNERKDFFVGGGVTPWSRYDVMQGLAVVEWGSV